jgi:alpha-1,3-rhamnosyl/mannosyltransferase
MPYRPGVPTVLTVHDLIPIHFPQQSTTRARLLFRHATLLALRAARHVIAVSEATRQDALVQFGIPAARITAIPHAADPAFRPQPPEVVAAVRARYALPINYALYLGSNKPHKNLLGLVEAWGMLRPQPVPLVIAGAWDSRYPAPRQRAEALGFGDGIRWLGSVPEPDLPALYSGALLFVFPSLYEGFGLPVLEAMACGAAVVCSNSSSLPEVASGAALLADPLDTRALAATMAQVLGDESLRRQMQEKGLARAQHFTWEQTARRTLDIYRN